MILDVVGEPYWERNLASLAVLGRMVVVGTMGGGRVSFNLGSLLQRRARVHGTTLRARPFEQKAALTQAFIHRVLPALASGAIQPVVDRVYPLAEVRAAHERMEANANFGKIVLAIGG